MEYEENLIPKEGQIFGQENQSVPEENQEMGGDNKNCQDNDQEGSTLDGRSKNSIQDALSLTIQDSRYDEVTKVDLEACSHVTNSTVGVN